MGSLHQEEGQEGESIVDNNYDTEKVAPKDLNKKINREKGRPTKMTPEVLKRLVDSIKAGNTYKAACQAAGISYSMFAEWVREGEKFKARLENNEPGVRPEYVNFLNVINKAKHEAEVALVAQIMKHSNKDWRAAAFLLERRNPEDWAKREYIEGETKTEHRIIFEDVEAKDDAAKPKRKSSDKGKGKGKTGSG